MGFFVDLAKNLLSEAGKMVVQGAAVGAKGGYALGKVTGSVLKETAKGAAQGAGMAVKVIASAGR